MVSISIPLLQVVRPKEVRGSRGKLELKLPPPSSGENPAYNQRVCAEVKARDNRKMSFNCYIPTAHVPNKFLWHYKNYALLLHSFPTNQVQVRHSCMSVTNFYRAKTKVDMICTAV